MVQVFGSVWIQVYGSVWIQVLENNIFFEKIVFRCGLLRNRTRKEIFGVFILKTFGTVIKKTAPNTHFLLRFQNRTKAHFLFWYGSIWYGFKTVPKGF